MADKSDERSGGIDIGGSASAGGDLAGRDKIIQNILIVGQVLDFAQVEGLIPKPAEAPDFEDISGALKKAFGERLDSDLAMATAAAGEILKGFLVKMAPSKPFEVLPFRDILPNIAEYLIKKLDELKYWDTYATERTQTLRARSPWSGYDVIGGTEILWLDSLSTLWNKSFKTKDEIQYGLKRDWGILFDLFASIRRAKYCIVIRVEGKTETFPQDNFSVWSRKQFHIFMAGLIIDLIRLTSAASNDIKFWEGLTKLLTPDKS